MNKWDSTVFKCIIGISGYVSLLLKIVCLVDIIFNYILRKSRIPYCCYITFEIWLWISSIIFWGVGFFFILNLKVNLIYFPGFLWRVNIVTFMYLNGIKTFGFKCKIERYVIQIISHSILEILQITWPNKDSNILLNFMW